MNRCPDLVVCLRRTLQCLRPEASLVLIYRPNVAGMKGRVDLAQPVNRTPDLWSLPVRFTWHCCGSPVVQVSDHGKHVMSSGTVPLKIRPVGQRCTLNLSRAEKFSRWCGVVVWRECTSSGVKHVTWPWFKITWFVANCPRVA
ncbi:uncharacterized protein TNCV_1838261 [Trichonephila clavipes]|nr:uncharacterized protein TNCV_1838261 [Trichonephila clavipes]